MRYFKVRFGYDKSAYTVVEEGPDLQRVIYAWIEQIPVSLGQAMVHGKSIISITPHYHKHTGWNEFYEPTSGDDWAQIERDCPKYDGVIENYKRHVNELIESGNQKMIGKTEVTLEIEAPNTNLLGSFAEKFKV